MSNIPADLSYSKDHEWIRVEGGTGTLGITDHAQRQLGDVVFVELPNPGDRFSSGEPLGSVESVKAVSEVYMPVSGDIRETNSELADNPELLNDDPYGDGWLVRITVTDPAELGGLLTAAEYEAYIKEEESE